jgi:hypothetical protein
MATGEGPIIRCIWHPFVHLASCSSGLVCAAPAASNHSTHGAARPSLLLSARQERAGIGETTIEQLQAYLAERTDGRSGILPLSSVSMPLIPMCQGARTHTFLQAQRWNEPSTIPANTARKFVEWFIIGGHFQPSCNRFCFANDLSCLPHKVFFNSAIKFVTEVGSYVICPLIIVFFFCQTHSPNTAIFRDFSYDPFDGYC